MENLTLVQELQNAKNEALKPLFEIQSDRMNRYMGCQDDTIIGGISDNLTNQEINRICRKYDLLIKQAENGGFITETQKILGLFDFSGNLLSTKIVNTKFGQCFVFEQYGQTKFVSIAKNQATFEKKGFKCISLNITYKYNFGGLVTKNGNFVFNNIEAISSSLNPINSNICNEMNYINNFSYLQYLINK